VTLFDYGASAWTPCPKCSTSRSPARRDAQGVCLDQEWCAKFAFSNHRWWAHWTKTAYEKDPEEMRRLFAPSMRHAESTATPPSAPQGLEGGAPSPRKPRGKRSKPSKRRATRPTPG
jgi:hypothetical protein